MIDFCSQDNPSMLLAFLLPAPTGVVSRQTFLPSQKCCTYPNDTLHIRTRIAIARFEIGMHVARNVIMYGLYRMRCQLLQACKAYTPPSPQPLHHGTSPPQQCNKFSNFPPKCRTKSKCVPGTHAHDRSDGQQSPLANALLPAPFRQLSP